MTFSFLRLLCHVKLLYYYINEIIRMNKTVELYHVPLFLENFPLGLDNSFKPPLLIHGPSLLLGKLEIYLLKFFVDVDDGFCKQKCLA